MLTVGLVVKIKPGTRFAHQNQDKGEIQEIEHNGWYKVKFADNYENSYKEEDLLVISASPLCEGEAVRIIPGSRYSYQSDVIGQITKVRMECTLPYAVSWPRRGSNTYGDEDLYAWGRNFAAITDIVKDAEVVEGINWWLEQEDGQQECPLTRGGDVSSQCDRLCHRLWPELKLFEGVKLPGTRVCSTCPCAHEELHVEETFQTISDLASLYIGKITKLPTTRRPTFSVGDIFESHDYQVILTSLPDDEVILVSLDGKTYYGDSTCVSNKEAICYEERPELWDKLTYIGNSKEVTISGGKVVKKA